MSIVKTLKQELVMISGYFGDKMFIKLISQLLFCLVILGMTTDCFSSEISSRPNKADALIQIKSLNEIPGIVSCSDVKYLNGYEEDRNNYVVIAQYKLTLNKSLKQIQDDELKRQKNKRKYKYEDDIEGGTSMGLYIILSIRFGIDSKEGETIVEKKQFNFIKTENGWLLSQ